MPTRLTIGLLILCLLCSAAAEDSVDTPQKTASLGEPSGLPLPSATPIYQFESILLDFLRQREYVRRGWQVDKAVRDTGPYIRGWNYGTHHTVRIYYSPETMTWLLAGKTGTLPDGAMIVKEQFGTLPAAAHLGKSEEELDAEIKAWTVMIKDKNGSHDGWFWSNPANSEEPPKDNHVYPFPHRESGFGTYCIRCHAVTQSAQEPHEFTFASLRNIKGFPGHPVLFRVDRSWHEAMQPAANPAEGEGEAVVAVSQDEGLGAHLRCTVSTGPTPCPTQRNADFLALFNTIGDQQPADLQSLPPVTHDLVVRAPQHRAATQDFVTSNQCMSCHAALLGEFGPVMFVHTEDVSTYKNGMSNYGGEGIDISPYGEWRWTPMGLAGRDPVFFAQMETELAILREELADQPDKLKHLSEKVTATCLRCHSPMASHTFQQDHADDPHALLAVANVHAHHSVHELQERHHQYGALARDGVSCTVCHRMQPRVQPADDDRPYLKFFLETSITGNIHLGPPGELYGPYKEDEIAPYAMEHGIGYTPKHSPYLSSSQMCGSCHTVNLPIVDFPFLAGETPNELARAESQPDFLNFHHHLEQATYLEWLNSEYENEFHPDNPKAQSCQDCHMSRDLHSPAYGVELASLPTQIAIIQDATYPDAENLAPHDQLHVQHRKEGYSRHNFSGLNVFLVEMFNQFDDVLGVRKRDYMTGTEQIPHAIENFKLTAAQKTADIELKLQQRGPRGLQASVLVRNKAGHRFPSGVGFRRAFLELVVLDTTRPVDDQIVWASGRTNNIGVLLGPDGKQLPTEFLERDSSGKQQYQPHHAVISSQDQVQIYEILLFNKSGEFTTSFIHGCDAIKDNRLLPRGWSKEGPDPESLNGYFLKATHPVGHAEQDPHYIQGNGSDETLYQITLPRGVNPRNVTVRATLYYQAMPPYFLKTIFDKADGPAARRLHHICANLNVEGTPIEDWKLKVVSAQQAL